MQIFQKRLSNEAATRRIKQLEEQCDSLKKEKTASDEKVAKAASALEASKRSCAEEILDLKRERNMAKASLESECAETTSEKRKNLRLTEQLKERDRRIQGRNLIFVLDILLSFLQNDYGSLTAMLVPWRNQ